MAIPQLAAVIAGHDQALLFPIASGQITVADVFMAMPYANELIILELTEKAIHAVFDRASKGLPEDEDVGGGACFRYCLHDHQPSGAHYDHRS